MCRSGGVTRPPRTILACPRRVRWLSALVVLASTACGVDQAARARLEQPHGHHESGRPNVLLVVLDTLRADRVSAIQPTAPSTPQLDRLAADGTLFSGAHSVAPWTLPAHASMFTGLLPSEHGATWQAFREPADADLEDILETTFALADPTRLLPVRLRALGYSTLGLTNNAWISRRTSFDTGFDTFDEMWKERRRLSWGYRLQPALVRTDRASDLGDAGMTLMQLKSRMLEAPLREPFFLFINFIDPHYPYSPPEPWRYAHSDDHELGERIASFEFSEQEMQAGTRPVDVSRFSPFYDGEVGYVDAVLGQLLDLLRRTGYYEETLIVVTSDHGELLGERGLFGHQFSVDEELMRVPLIVKFPGPPRPARNDDPLASNLDVYRTILAAAGAEDDAADRSLDLARGTPLGRTHLIGEYSFAEPYLRSNLEAFSDFPIAEYRADRRVVYTRHGRELFVGPAASLESDGRADEVDGHRVVARDLLDSYLEGLEAGTLRRTPRPVDPDTLERLRSLGYVR